MKMIGWLFNQQHSPATARRIAGAFGATLLLMMAGVAVAQEPAALMPGAQVSAPNGYEIHQTFDAGERMNSIHGSGSMYDTMVNMQKGPRVLGETLEMHALSGNKNPLVDDLKAFSNGFGGDPYNFAKLDFSKSKYYEFTGMFRRDRQYFDYDLLGNPGIPTGYSIPIGPTTSPVGQMAWPQINDSPFMWNTVRRMTDAKLTLFPVSNVTFRLAYSQNIIQGPSITPSGNSIAGQELLLQEYQRNSTDDFTAGMDWKALPKTKLTFEEEVTRYKGNSYFTMDPAFYTVQEADGTKVAMLTSYQNYYPYGYSSSGAWSPACSSSVANPNQILYPNANGLPIIDPACSVISSYYRSQPTRVFVPTEIFRLQSSSLKNVTMNGDVRYTRGTMHMPNYWEQFQGLSGAVRQNYYAANGKANRTVIAVDYGIVWQATKKVALEDQVTYSNVHQPGGTQPTAATQWSTPTAAPNDTINYTGALTSSTISPITGSEPSGGTLAALSTGYDYFGQKFVTNNATATWDVTDRASVSLTYRYQAHDIVEGSQNGTGPQTGAEVFTINENGGIVNAAWRPTDNLDLNGTVLVLYDNNVFTPVGPRQTKQYRFHALYRPKAWASVSGSYTDRERHNNTNNTGVASAVGPLDHVDYSRVASFSAAVTPNEHYGFDFDYSYSDVYTATNICYQSAAQAMPGSGVVAGAALQNGNLCAPISAGHGQNTTLSGPALDFEDAPTQFGSATLSLNPTVKLHTNLGYRITSTNGSRFFTDVLDVNGSLVSSYQTPFASVAYTMHKGFIWKAEYNHYNYGEGGPSGAQWCNTNPGLAIGTASESGSVVACNTLANAGISTKYGFTAPRNFHSNNYMLGVHWEF